MALKDYYLILGISRSEPPSGIRARYRDLARRFHPDVAGAESTSRFQEITEAYETLADPAARRRYNAELARLERRPPRDSIEPLPAPRRGPVSLFAEPEALTPSFEALFRNFTGVDLPKAQRPEPLTVEVILTHEEAVRGVTVPIGVPGLEACSHCGGTGGVWLFPCASCEAEGAIATEHVVRVTIPPLSRPTSIIQAPLYGLGIDNLYLRLYVRVEDYW